MRYVWFCSVIFNLFFYLTLVNSLSTLYEQPLKISALYPELVYLQGIWKRNILERFKENVHVIVLYCF